jgi:hypothetical protein
MTKAVVIISGFIGLFAIAVLWCLNEGSGVDDDAIHTSCTPVGGGAVAYDANAGERGQVATGCLYGKGWSLVTRKQAEDMKAAITPASAPTSPAPQPLRSQDVLDGMRQACAGGDAAACQTVQDLQGQQP